MKKLTVLFLLTFCLGQSLSSQTFSNDITETKTDKQFYFGIGFGIGFFYPGDVNDYILDNTSNLLITNGVADIVTNIVGRVSLTYRINSSVDLSLIGEFAWAPKYLVLSVGDDLYFNFNRVSPGLIAKFHIPIKSGQNSIFFAPGLLYNTMKFEEFKGSALGFRLETGLSFNFNRVNLQPFISYDFANATAENYPDFELNYSGIQFGVDFNF